MAKSTRCYTADCENCKSVTQPLKYGDFLFKGKRTLIKKQRYKPNIEELGDIFESDSHSIPLDDLLKRLDTDAENGLSEEQVFSLTERFGLNVLSSPKSNRWIRFRSSLRGSFFFQILGIITCFAVVVMTSDDPTETFDAYHMSLGFLIIITVVVPAFISLWQEEKSFKVMNSFNDLYPQYASVIRGGQKFRINQRDIVVGDLVLLKAGSRVPADIRITETWNLTVDDLPLVCRSESVLKTPECTSQNPTMTQNMVFFGTLCMEGYGQGIVVSTGDHTAYAQMMRKTVVVQKLDTVIYRVVRQMIGTVGAFTFIAGIMLFVLNLNSSWIVVHSWTGIFILVLVQIMASMPNILYSAITLCLSSSAQKMAFNCCLPKNYKIVETLGAVTVICCHKTGMITQNRMTVVRLWLDGKVTNVEPSQDRSKMTLDQSISRETWDAFSRAMCLCSTTDSKKRRNRCIIKEGCSCDPTEVAIMEFMNHVSQDGSTSNGRIDYNRNKYRKLFEIPLNSFRKYHVTIHDMSHSSTKLDCEFLLCMKGAVEVILNFCSTALISGKEAPISSLEDLGFLVAFEDLMEYGERIIGFCDYIFPAKQFDRNHVFREADVPTSGFRFLGFVAILDPPRASVTGDIADCRKAGIKVIMITSDHPTTSTAIAKQVGIISTESETRNEIAKRFNITTQQVTPGTVDAAVVTGSELRLMDRRVLRQLLKDYPEIVFARIDPSQKLDIVASLQEDGHVVAISGDNLDDCLAMTRADIGIGMGMYGSDISRDSSDVILLGDNFVSLVASIKEGRVIYDNVRNAIVFVLSSNLPEVSPLLVATLFDIPMPIAPVLILLVTLIVETFSVLVLAQEKAENDIMKKRPLGPKTIFNNRLVQKAYHLIGAIGAVSGFFAYFMVMSQHGFFPKSIVGNKKRWDSPAINDLADSFNQEWSYRSRKELEHTSQTAFFGTIIVLQWFNIGFCRTRRQSVARCDLRSAYVITFIFLQFSVAAFFIYTPGISTVLNMFPLKFTWWLMGVAFGLFYLIYEEIRRFILRYAGKDSWLNRESF